MFDHIRYYIATIIVLVGIVGNILGGQWVWIGFVGVFAFLLLGELIFGEDEAERKIRYPWIADFALYLHLLMMILLYASFAWRIDQGFNEPTTLMTVVAYAGSVISVGFLSAVPNLPINHELMHRRALFPRLVASILGTFYGDPNRDLSHVYTHHIHVGTKKDTDTSYRGETIYTFVFRATWGSYKDGYKIEKERQEKMGRSVWSWSSRFPRMIVMIAILIGIFYYINGWLGALLVISSMFIAKMFVEGFNYTQHYGLIREEGKPFEPRHAWEHRTPFTRAVAVEITTHANHHLDSYVPFYELKPSTEDNKMPTIILCFLMSLVPPLWFRFVKPKLKKIDVLYSTQEEKILAKKANGRAGWPNWLEDEPVSA